MARYPLNLSFGCVLAGDDLPDVLRLFAQAAEAAGFPAVTGWSIPADGGTTARTLEQALAGPGGGAPEDAAFGCEGGCRGFAYRHRGELAAYVVTIDKPSRDRPPAEIRAFLRGAAAVSAELARRSRLVEVHLTREGGGVLAIPYVPLVRSHSHLTWVSSEAVAGAYERPADFWPGWEVSAEDGERKLLSRGLDLAAGPKYLELILPHQWRMARAAKPGLTRYSMPQLEPEEEEIFRAGGPFLGEVGYLEDEHVVEFTCVLPTGEHLPGWEVYKVRQLVREGRLPDGRRVEGVRVVFLDRWAAEQEKRPLLDVGARVFCYGDDGELTEITQPAEEASWRAPAAP